MPRVFTLDDPSFPIQTPAEPTAPGMFDGIPLVMVVFIAAVAALTVIAAVVSVVAAVKRHRHLRRHGIDPFAAEAQLYTAAMGSSALAPRRTLEEHLAELEALHAAGKISGEEYAAARTSALLRRP